MNVIKTKMVYFLLTKPTSDAVNNNANNEIIEIMPGKQVYILPHNILHYYKTFGLFENILIEYCKQFCNKDSIFLDIGAHSGTYSIALAPYCNQVYAFEPQKMTYYCLCGSVALSNLSNINCLQYGLGSTEQRGKQILNIVSVDGGSSTLHARTDVLCYEEIDMKTLDDLNLLNISFIKMDIEENEYYALLGARETLNKNNFPNILFELNPNNQLLQNTIHLLVNYGYNVSSISEYPNMFLAHR